MSLLNGLNEINNKVDTQERKAWALAASMYGTRKFFDDVPLIVHVAEVAGYFSGETHRLVAILHNVLNVCPRGERYELSQHIRSTFGDEVADAIAVIYNENRWAYTKQHLEVVCANALAWSVLCASMRVYIRYAERVCPEHQWSAERLHKNLAYLRNNNRFGLDYEQDEMIAGLE